ncbi:MAG: OmpA family protein [Kofleriaceae bacterium]
MKSLKLALVFALGACGAHMPPQQLVDARAAYDHAASSPASKTVPAEVHVARESLDAAEKKFADDPDSKDVVDLAYIAQRKAQRAEALGVVASANDSLALSVKDRSKTQEAIITAQQDQLQNAHSSLEKSHEALEKQKQMTEQERAAREQAEKKAQDAMDALSKQMAVKADTRGTVITLSGGVLFATGQAALLPGAQASLNSVADALKTQAEHHFTVEGHTDNQGTDAINNDLSLRRAQAVRDYLVIHGVASETITAQGFGSTRPIADNKTAEGRGMNRRVEIIVDPARTAAN